ncbi:MAG: alpha-amylase family protein [Planctomycetota bacterium]
MLKIIKNKDSVLVQTTTTTLQWDLTRGGQITKCDLKGYQASHSLLKNDQPVPNLTLDLGKTLISLADSPVETEFIRRTEDRFTFRTKARYADMFTIEQEYDVFPEGIVFCEFAVVLDDGKKANVRNAYMTFPLHILDAKKLRGNYISRDLYLKQDVTCVHVLSSTEICMDRDKTADIPHLLSLYGLDLGWSESRYFSNRFEMAIEDSTSLGGQMLAPTRTIAGPQKNHWQLTWKLCENSSEQITGPFLYRNKWAIFCGSARTHAGPNADPARRTNVMGARICHIMYPYVRQGDEWPWCSVPIRQTFYQDVQLAKGNPSIDRIDEAADLGANILILHQFWMRNGGSNGEPMADYKVNDPEWFKAVIDRAHKRGMRVAVYMRGIEHYSLYYDFFEKYMKKDWDGLYIDWASPFGLGYTKSTSKHCSIFNWFMFIRALRKRVGSGGFLIGHTSVQTHASYALFDAALTGEFSVMHAGLLASPEISASYSGSAGCAVHLMSGNSPDRAVFSSQKAAGFSAALAYSNHPFMEPDIEFKKVNAYIQPLWDLFTALGSDPVRMYNPNVGTEKVFEWSEDALHPIAYKNAEGTVLVIVTNLSEQTVSATVDVDLKAIGIDPAKKITPLKIKGTHTAEVRNTKITIDNMPPYFFTGLLIG